MTLDLTHVLKSLDRLTLTVAAAVAGQWKDDLGSKVQRLTSLGFSDAQIAAVLDTTANTVKVTRYQAKKKTAKKKAGKAGGKR